MARASKKRRAYSPKRSKQGAAKASKGSAAFIPLVETKLKGAGRQAARVVKGKGEVPDVFSDEAIQASRDADLRHRKARRNAKTRSGRLFFG